MLRSLRRRRGDAAAVELPDGWLAPYTGGAEAVAIGNLDGASATVDERGLLTVDGRWSLDWWISASDRWHVPAREAPTAIVQRLVAGTPVVETSVRVPGGQVVHRAWCTRSGDGEWAVVEVENRSREPVGVALAVRPTTPTGRGRVGHLDLDGTVVRVDGDLLALARRPAHVALAAEEDVADVVLASNAAAAPHTGVRSSSGLANGAFVFPLAHTARLRAAVRLGDGALVDVDAIGDHEAVVRGWQAHLAAGTRVDIPDPDLMLLVNASRCAALLDPTGAVLGGLDRWGHGGSADAAAVATVERGGRFSAAEAAALARHALLRGEAGAGVLEPVLVPLAAAAHAAPIDQRLVLAVADALDLADQPDAAAACRDLVPAVPAPAADAVTPAAADEARLRELVASASPVGSWSEDSERNRGEVLELAGRLLVDDRPGGVVAVASSWPDRWLGQPAEVHGVPTRHGSMSWAVRWHGARPALLWELQAAAASVVAPGLDVTWRADEPSGEALLAPVEPAGGLPGVVAREKLEGTPVDDAGSTGTFS